MRATRYCLSVVGKGRTLAPPKLGAAVTDVGPFLHSHVDSLVRGAIDGRAPLTRFKNADRQSRITDLKIGSDQQFLAAADLLASELQAEMLRVASKPGVLVCVSFESDDGNTLAAALKLQVMSDHGAILERLASGETVLSAVERVLDRPGELQKGLVYPDRRADSQAVIGDKANQREARYFLEAMGVKADENARKALGSLAQALADAAPAADRARVVRQLDAAASGELGDVIGAAVDGVDLAPAELDRLTRDLGRRDRPIRRIDTAASLKVTLAAGSVRVVYAAADSERVTVDRSVRGGWDIVIHVDDEPERRYQS